VKILRESISSTVWSEFGSPFSRIVWTGGRDEPGSLGYRRRCRKHPAVRGSLRAIQPKGQANWPRIYRLSRFFQGRFMIGLNDRRFSTSQIARWIPATVPLETQGGRKT
jgi:hypothetical protein